MFIAPKKNDSKRLQMERFNSFVYSCAVFLQLDPDISAFLATFPHITNQLACVVRSFEPLEYVRILAAVAVLVGIHLPEPFRCLTSSSTTHNDKLMVAFPALYDDLTTTPMDRLLDLTKPAFSFVSQKRWEQCLYSKELLAPVTKIVEANKCEVVKVLQVLLPRLAAGWERQRGDQFQFGPNVDPEAPNRITAMDMASLATAPVNNLDAERSVGFINYELDIRGKKELAAASRSHVKSRGAKLKEGEVMGKQFKKITEKDGSFESIMNEWKTKQDQLKQDGLDNKGVANLAMEKQRNTDLTKLIALGGPFTSSAEVTEYEAKKDVSDKDKNARLYIEVFIFQ